MTSSLTDIPQMTPHSDTESSRTGRIRKPWAALERTSARETSADYLKAVVYLRGAECPLIARSGPFNFIVEWASHRALLFRVLTLGGDMNPSQSDGVARSLEGVPFLSCLSPAERREIERHCRFHEFGTDEKIIQQGRDAFERACDNRATMHSGTGGYEGKPRTLWRMIVGGTG